MLTSAKQFTTFPIHTPPSTQQKHCLPVNTNFHLSEGL